MKLCKSNPVDPLTNSLTYPDLAESVKSTAPDKKCRACRCNWYDPPVWALISAAAQRTGFSSPQNIARELQKGSSGVLFKTIYRSTIVPWINKERTGWTSEVLSRVSRAAAINTARDAPRIASSGKKLGRPARLNPYPSLVQNVVTLLTNMRNSGTLITRSVAQSVILAFICSDAPRLFHDPRFKCSESFICRFLHNKLNWSWRATTQAAQKLPANWEDQCVDLAHRLTWNIALHNVPPELVINADQTGVSYLGTGRKTWELKGVPQVPGFGQDEKRQFTLMVAVTAAGQTLPFQAIYKGSSDKSLPSGSGCDSCKSVGFVFTSGGNKHWSNLESMKDWVDKVVVVFANQERQRLGLPPTQKVIVTIDCWSVHRGAPFRNWVKKKYPWIILLFIPGGCTSVAQPCDTRINRVLKHCIKSACVEYLAEMTQTQLRNNVKPSDIEIDTSPGTLRNASANWILSAWNWLKDHPQVVLDSWASASFKGWDLSYASLTSAKSRALVHERFHEDQDFALSVVQAARQMPDDPNFEEEDSRVDYDDDYALDPDVLVDIRGRLSAHVVERQGDFDYTGDEDLTDNDVEGEEDPECFEWD